MIPLPIDEVLPRLSVALAEASACVLTAPPGSGKSTRVPPLLTGLLPGQVYLLQPRRIAAKSLAKRIAQEQPGWQLGREVGYRVRFDTIGGAQTRLWVMTEGSLTRQLAQDPFLEGISAIILDEFHERSLHTDLAISYLREVQRTVRPDLKLVVMSATINAQEVAGFLGNCPIVEAPGRTYPVAVSNRAELPGKYVSDQVVPAVLAALEHPDCGDILVFLPGMGEIRSCERALGDAFAAAGITREICPLHGSLPPEVQDRALSPSDQPKVVLATNVAETSVTIPGVRTVIDTGTARVQRHNPATGLDELRLEPVSRFSLDQRAGRAGRTAPGRCIRLSSPLVDARRPQAADPELHRVDLAGTLLTLKLWDYADSRTFPWFSAPEAERIEAAEDLLHALGATVAPHGALTARGKKLAELPVHPRLGRLLLDAAAAGQTRLGASLAALTGERDVRLAQRGGGPAPAPAVADALDRLELLAIAERENFHAGLRQRGIDPGAAWENARIRDDLVRLVPSAPHQPADLTTLVPRLLLAAFPDRVAKRAAPDANRGSMTGGVAIELDAQSAVAARSGYPRPELFLAVNCQGLGQGMRASTVVRQAAELTEEDLAAVFPGSVARRERLTWDESKQQVAAQIGWYYRDLAIRMVRDGQPDPAAVAAFLAQRLAPEAPALIAAAEALANWLARYRWLRMVAPDLDLPEISDADLAALVADLCVGCRARAEVVAKLANEGLERLTGRLSWQQTRQVEDWAPSHYPVPTGNRIRLDYTQADATTPPVLAVRLQELFGEPATPRIADGRVGVLLHLLGPNYRCEQVTRDLASFWANTYPQVRKDLRGRYPKHSWPDDPLAALPVARGRPRQ
jgi:ATP-dependent helicase HrpB